MGDSKSGSGPGAAAGSLTSSLNVHAPSIDLATLSISDGFRIEGELGQTGFDVGSAGDVNGDGLADLIVTAASGVAYVVFGTPSPPTTDLLLSQLTPSEGVRCESRRSVVGGDGVPNTT